MRIVNGREMNRCESATTPELDFPDGNRGLVSALCPLTILRCCLADGAFSCVLTYYDAFLGIAALSALFVLFWLSGQPRIFLKVV